MPKQSAIKNLFLFTKYPNIWELPITQFFKFLTNVSEQPVFLIFKCQTKFNWPIL